MDKVTRTCPVCSQLFDTYDPAKRYCTRLCKDRRQRVRHRREVYAGVHSCRECGESFTANHRIAYLCGRCVMLDTQERNKHRSRERAKQKHDLLMLMLVERDGPTCHICGELVEFEPEDRMRRPSVDHVIPLVKGGLNVPSNVKLSHRRCNVKKGDR